MHSARERVVLRDVVHEIIAAVRMKSQHPSKNQLRQVLNRNLFILDADAITKHKYQLVEL